MKGWVYVITNKAMPGIVKVGFSTKDPELRAAELNHTGSPLPYVVDYEALVEEPRGVEQAAHRHLSSHSEGKEWFRCSTEHAIAALKTACGNSVYLENYKQADRVRAEQIRVEQLGRAERERRAEKERVESAKRVEEARNRAREELMSRKVEINERYAERLKALEPQVNYWTIFFVAYFCTLFILILILPNAKEGAILFVSIFLTLIEAFFIQEHLTEKSKQSKEYLSLVAARDTELTKAALELNRRG